LFPAKVDPAHYKVVFNNPLVRVPEKSTQADGKTTTVTTKAGQVVWRNAQTHL
jgi:hypothetical protein